MDVNEASLSLHHLFHRAPGSWLKLLKMFDFEPVSLLNRLDSVVMRECGMRQASIDLVEQRRMTLKDAVAGSLRWLDQAGNGMVSFGDSDYPNLLTEIYRPPPVLFIRGNRALLQHPGVAVVGSRRASRGGLKSAADLSQALSSRGAVIVSGLAEGIDGAAHEAVLDIGGSTIAVLGNGCDLIYPRSHRGLYHRMVDQGLVMSEFPLGEPPRRENFPVRNRIVTGLCLGTVVIEAGQKSGTLVSARLATEQNRELFAVPGSPHNPLSRGCHELIRDGARLVMDVNDILEELPELCGSEDRHPDLSIPATLRPIPVELQQLVIVLDLDPLSVDEITLKSGLSVQEVLAGLMSLEVSGIVVSEPAGYSLSPGWSTDSR